MTDINKTIQKWHASFSKGTDFDSWGQLVEAIDEYHMKILAPGEEENLELEEEDDAGAGSPDSFTTKVPGAAIFFELKHYKPKKRFTSTKCFAFMEMDEIKPGPIIVELYKKPTDFKRKKLNLLTKKPLYLHLRQTLHKE
ncbi:Axin interactor, dorsalization-associated protein [Acipenser ruthenus]|uniref:Axin interactor, dorsalization-associated protein n=1 Tax=Acipenser ruthenus TaxID=7906 RepID=A0A444UEW6_ACIRT|nr:Axin interactor, dorsalization-associated protein [Acipenser ruthenus]